MERWIKVGYGKVDITPQPGTPLGGYGNDSHRLCTDIGDVSFFTYIASEVAYTYPCYEVQSRLFPKGTGEMLATNMLEMLKEMQ